MYDKPVTFVGGAAGLTRLSWCWLDTDFVVCVKERSSVCCLQNDKGEQRVEKMNFVGTFLDK